MATVTTNSLSSTPRIFSLYYGNLKNNNKTYFLSLKPPVHKLNKLQQQQQCVAALASSSVAFNPLSFGTTGYKEVAMVKSKKKRGFGTVCYAAPVSTHNLQWISAISTAALMLTKGTAVHKSFLVPLFALQAPATIIAWIKGEYGVWAAFLALLVRLFFHIPGELELPFMALLLVIVAPYQVINLRGRQEGGIISLAIAAYMAFQHFSRAGSLQRAFDQGSIVGTVAVICITIVSILLLI